MALPNPPEYSESEDSEESCADDSGSESEESSPADPYEKFKCVSTELVRDHLQQEYFYEDEKDQLSIVVGYGHKRRIIEMGGCEELLDKDVEELKADYEREIEVYEKLNDTVSEGFAQMEEVNDRDDLDRENKAYYKEDIWKGSLRDDLSERNAQANIVSKIYFSIWLKSKSETETEGNVEAEKEEDEISPPSPKKSRVD